MDSDVMKSNNFYTPEGKAAFGRLVKECREEKGVDQTQFAYLIIRGLTLNEGQGDYSFINRFAIGNLENASYSHPGAAVLFALAASEILRFKDKKGRRKGRPVSEKEIHKILAGKISADTGHSLPESECAAVH